MNKMIGFRRLLAVALVLCLCVVVFGAYVRLSDAGLGCPDWPGCYGHLTIPQADHEVARAEEKFPERPVEAPKAWKEMIHRYLASILGLLIVALAVMASLDRTRQLPRLLPWLLVGLVTFQGTLGMWTVTLLLKPLVVTAHLLGGMSTLALLWLLWLRVQPRDSATPPAIPRLRRYAAAALLLVATQIFLGGWTSTNYAALACPDFPTCHGQWWPEMDADEAFTLWRGLGINYEYGVLDNRARVTIHFVHRIGALVVTAALLWLGYLLLRQADVRWKIQGGALLAALATQIVIGISVVVQQLPLWLASAHNAGAAVLLLVVVMLNHRAWTAART